MKIYKKLRTFACCILCVLCAISLCACSPITLTTYEYASGEVSSQIDMNLTSLRTAGNNLSYGTKVEIVYEIVERYSAQLTSAYKNKLIELFSNEYDFDGMTDNEKIAYILDKNPSLDVEINISPNRYGDGQNSIMFSYSAVDRVRVESWFKSIKGYILFFYPDAYIWDEESKSIILDRSVYSSLSDVPISASSVEEKEDLLFKTYIQTATPFSYNGEEAKLLKNTTIKGVLYPQGTTILNVACSALALEGSDAEYVFNFATPYRRVSSNGSTHYEDGYYVHTWNFGNDANKSVTLRRRIANYTSWYAFGAISGVLVAVVGLIVVKIGKKAKKNKAKKEFMSVAEFVNDKNGGAN